MRTRAIGIAGISAGVLILATACGSTHPAASATRPAQTTTAAAPAPGITCGAVSSDLATALHDLKVSYSHLQEAWVSGGYSNDLQNLINDTQSAGGTDQLNTDAATLNSDASGYLANNSPYLAPGWETDYSNVTADINAMATDCGMKTVPKGA